MATDDSADRAVPGGPGRARGHDSLDAGAAADLAADLRAAVDADGDPVHPVEKMAAALSGRGK